LEKIMNFHHLGVRLTAPLLALSSVACGADSMADNELEKLGSISEPFSVSSCSTPSPNEVDDGIIASHSPASYSNGSCYNGYIVDVVNWDTDNAITINQEWAAAAPTTETSCRKIWMSLIIYQKLGSGWFQLGQQLNRYGSWTGSSCKVPTLTWESETFIDGGSYRFAGTARPYYGATVTRDFRLVQDGG
jgi:hypothetical protein